MIYSYLNNATTADGIHSIAWTTQWTFHEVVVLGIVSLILGTIIYMYRRLLVTGGKSNTKSIGYNISSWGKTNTAMTVISKKSTVWKSLFTSHGAFSNGEWHISMSFCRISSNLPSKACVSPVGNTTVSLSWSYFFLLRNCCWYDVVAIILLYVFCVWCSSCVCVSKNKTTVDIAEPQIVNCEGIPERHETRTFRSTCGHKKGIWSPLCAQPSASKH